LAEVALLLRRQGVVVERMPDAWRGEAERFRVDSVVAEPYVFEGHRTVRVEGAWGAAAAYEAQPGSFLVRTDQPLGTFACYLLEPASEDGVVTWNLVDRVLSTRFPHPIVRVRAPVWVRSVALDRPTP
jgi:dipeptidyl-peptidase-4